MEPLALYIHWPFCLHKCPYCDFNSHVRDTQPTRRFGQALRTELAWEGQRLGRRPLQSVFFGGGTPSLMDPDDVAALLADATRLFDPAPGLEVTLEANPTSIERGRMRAFAGAGVNRVSVGIQSLRDDALRRLGRQHSAADAVAALRTARDTFPRVSFDLIYARPGEGRAAWDAELQQALFLCADHLSLYQLTVEPGTAYEALHRRGELVLPDADEAADLYALTLDRCAAHGLQAYEVSNLAAPGAEGRHNLQYWRYGDYAGIGPGAHGRVTLDGTLHATRRHRAPEPWADRVERDGHGSTANEVLTAADRAQEMLLMGLRLAEGVDAARFHTRTGMALLDALDAGVLAQAVAEGYVLWDGSRLQATAEGRLRLDALLGALVT